MNERRAEPPSSANSRRRIFPPADIGSYPVRHNSQLKPKHSALTDRSRRCPSRSYPATSRALQNISPGICFPHTPSTRAARALVIAYFIHTICPPQRRNRGPCTTRSSTTTLSTSKMMALACCISVRRPGSPRIDLNPLTPRYRPASRSRGDLASGF